MLQSNSPNWETIEGLTLPRKTGSRSLKRGIPDTEKDLKYWEKRKKNNLSAKKSREKSKQVEHHIRNRCISLENENALLRRELAIIKSRYRIPPEEVFLTDRDREECSREVNETLSHALYNPGRETESLSHSKDADKIINTVTSASPVCRTHPDTTTSPAPDNHINSVNKQNPNYQILVDATVTPQEYLWNRYPESSPTPQYVFYRPMEEDSDSRDNNSPADLSMNKKAPVTEHAVTESDRDVFNSKTYTGLKIAASTLGRDCKGVVAHSKTNQVPQNTAARDTEHAEMCRQNKSDEDVTVLDLTCDDDEKDVDDDLNLKLKKLADQIVAMQTLVSLRVGVKQD